MNERGGRTPATMLKGTKVYRVLWQPQTDLLLGYCWCGAAHESEDPIELWAWLLDHPDTHGSGGEGAGSPPPAGARRLERV